VDPTGATAPPSRRPHPLLFLAVAAGWLALDQLTKSWAVSRLPEGDIDVVWTLRLRLTFNSGASFSMGDGYGRWIALVALVIVVVLVWQGLKSTSRLTAVALALIVGGALGNVIDRALRSGNGHLLGGAVVDFIDLRWWPVFNVADMGVVVGAVLLVVSSLLPEPDESPPDTSAGAADEA
jgi:signal peptidase II